jgi:hypothetical protein
LHRYVRKRKEVIGVGFLIHNTINTVVDSVSILHFGSSFTYSCAAFSETPVAEKNPKYSVGYIPQTDSRHIKLLSLFMQGRGAVKPPSLNYSSVAAVSRTAMKRWLRMTAVVIAFQPT